MTCQSVQDKIYQGYAIAASKLGSSYDLHRPVTALDMLPNYETTLYASFNAQDITYKKPNKYGNAVWYGLFDGRLTQVGDYLINENGQTYFIASMQYLLPIQCIGCNRTISVYEEDLSNYDNVELTPIMSGWPCSILMSGTRVASGIDFPETIGQGEFNCLLPYFDGVELNTGYKIIDEKGSSYTIKVIELTDMGWRMKVQRVHK